MGLQMLVIDKNIEVHEEQQKAWSSHGGSAVRVDTMLEGIEKLIKSDFVVVAINADNVNYMPQLQIMHDITNAPIFIVKKDYTVEEHTEALKNGADVFGTWAETAEKNAAAMLALLDRHSIRAKRHKKAIKILSHGNLLLTPDYRQVFVGDAEIQLTKKEFDILYYLLLNRGRLLPHGQILRRIWGDEYDKATTDVLWNHIKNLRKKLIAASPDFEYIQTMHSVGYKFTTQTDKKE